MSHDGSGSLPEPTTGVVAIGPELHSFTEHNSGPDAQRTLRCRTVAAGVFKQTNYIRNIPPRAMEQRTGPAPDGEVGKAQENAPVPTPAEAMLAALGSCIAVGIQANAVARNVPIRDLTLDVEADFDPSAAWGLVKANPGRIGFTSVRIIAHISSDAPREVLDALVQHAVLWSPASNTFFNPVHVEAALGEAAEAPRTGKREERNPSLAATNQRG